MKNILTASLAAVLLAGGAYAEPGAKSAEAHAGHEEAGKTDKAVQQRWAERIESGAAYAESELWPDYLELEPISIEDILGTWRGGKFDGGAEPDPINWYGKRFNSADFVEPLLVNKADGSIGVFDKLGAARLRDVQFKGKVSATIIYDSQPIMDYFRKVDDDTIIGWGEVKGESPDFFFWLKRDPAGN